MFLFFFFFLMTCMFKKIYILKKLNSRLQCDNIYCTCYMLYVFLPFCCEFSATTLPLRTMYWIAVTMTLQRDEAFHSGPVPLSAWLVCTDQRLNLSQIGTMNFGWLRM